MSAAKHISLDEEDATRSKEYSGLLAEKQCPGLALIFNYKIFKNHPEMERKYSHLDVVRLKHTLNMYNFSTEDFLDKTESETKSILREWSKKNYQNENSFLLFLMSHGHTGTVETSDCAKMNINEFLNPFKRNDSLMNKPKLFFVQCRMSKRFQVSFDKMNPDEMADERDACQVPLNENFLYSYSIEGDIYSNESKECVGSWLFQTLCDIIVEENGEKDILHILERIKSIALKNGEVKLNSMLIKDSRLRSRFYFNNKTFRKTSQNVTFTATSNETQLLDGRYKFLECIGEGSFGVVYLALDTKNDNEKVKKY